MFALLLFFNANATGNSTNTAAQPNYEETLNNIPVHLQYDKDKYFVSGYEDTVDVHLSSANRVQLNLETNEDTRNFQVVADLTNVSLGTTEVPLKIKGLSSAVTAKMEPKTITVTIEKKVTKTFKVEAQLPDSIEKEGYKVKNISLNPDTVDITTGAETAKAITKVVAPITSTDQTDGTIKQMVNVQALDAKGQVLSIENPAPQVKVAVALLAPTKNVPLTINLTGSTPADISHYTYSLSQDSVIVSGAQSILNTLDTITLPVDISAVHSRKKVTIKVPITGKYTVEPEEVELTLVPVYKETQSDSDKSTNSSTTNATSNPQGGTPTSSTNQAEKASTSESNQGSTSDTIDSSEN